MEKIREVLIVLVLGFFLVQFIILEKKVSKLQEADVVFNAKVSGAIGPDDPSGVPIFELGPDLKKLHKAYLDHEAHELPAIKAEEHGYVIGSEADGNWTAYREQVQKCAPIGEVIKIAISKTIDGRDYVLRMYPIDDHQSPCSVWLLGGQEGLLPVRAVSPY